MNSDQWEEVDRYKVIEGDRMYISAGQYQVNCMSETGKRQHLRLFRVANGVEPANTLASAAPLNDLPLHRTGSANSTRICCGRSNGDDLLPWLEEYVNGPNASRSELEAELEVGTLVGQLAGPQIVQSSGQVYYSNDIFL